MQLGRQIWEKAGDESWCQIETQGLQTQANHGNLAVPEYAPRPGKADNRRRRMF